MFKKVLIVLMVGCLLLGMATRAEAENAVEESETPKDTVTDTLTQSRNKSENGYRIEVVKEKLRGGENEEEIRFVSPEGNVVKTIESYNYKTSVSEANGQWNTEIDHVEAISGNKNAVLIWECQYSTGYNPQGKEGPHGDRRQYTVELLNARGETAFKKDFEVYHPGSLAIPFWETGLSKDGSTVFVFYGDESDTFHIEIYDRNGVKLAEAEHANDFYGNMEISPDGKIFGANTYKEGLGKCMLFLDVDSGRTKFVKSSGEDWRGYFVLSSTPVLPRSGMVRLGWQPFGEKYDKIPGGGVKTRDVSFDEIPSTLSNLFRGKK